MTWRWKLSLRTLRLYVFPIVVCPFVLFLLAFVLSVLRYTVSDCPFGIFKLFLWTTENRVRSNYCTSGIRRVNLATNSVISREWGKDREVLTTSGTYPWSFVTQIFQNGQPSHGGGRKIFEVMTSDGWNFEWLLTTIRRCVAYHILVCPPKVMASNFFISWDPYMKYIFLKWYDNPELVVHIYNFTINAVISQLSFKDLEVLKTGKT
jgi:hypothetical protein